MVNIGKVEIWDARNNFIAGAGMAGMAAMLEPSALPLAGLLATMIADPDAMSRGASEWRNEGAAPASGSCVRISKRSSRHSSRTDI
ncbi:hypothetical protein GCM10027612_22860 [Microbispora bryophytorum subsp. camponoti]